MEPEAIIEEDVSGLSPETKDFFDKAGKPEKKKPEEKRDPAAKEPEAKKDPAEKKADPAAKDPKANEKEPAPKDPPEVELKKYQAAMSEERERRKEIAEQLKQEASKRQHMEERFNKFLQLVQQEPERKAPEFNEDPAGHLKASQDKTARELEELRKWRDESQQATAQHQQLARFQAHVSEQTHSFMKDTPDYADAYNHVRSIRSQELAAMGAPADQVEGLLNRWEMQLSAAAVQYGKNPAATLYAQAQALGYKKAAPAPEAGDADKKKLENIAKGQEAAKALGSGGTPAEGLSLEKIMAMDEEEMADLVRGRGWNKVAKLFKN